MANVKDSFIDDMQHNYKHNRRQIYKVETTNIFEKLTQKFSNSKTSKH